MTNPRDEAAGAYADLPDSSDIETGRWEIALNAHLAGWDAALAHLSKQGEAEFDERAAFKPMFERGYDSEKEPDARLFIEGARYQHAKDQAVIAHWKQQFEILSLSCEAKEIAALKADIKRLSDELLRMCDLVRGGESIAVGRVLDERDKLREELAESKRDADICATANGELLMERDELKRENERLTKLLGEPGEGNRYRLLLTENTRLTRALEFCANSDNSPMVCATIAREALSGKKGG